MRFELTLGRLFLAISFSISFWKATWPIVNLYFQRICQSDLSLRLPLFLSDLSLERLQMTSLGRNFKLSLVWLALPLRQKSLSRVIDVMGGHKWYSSL